MSAQITKATATGSASGHRPSLSLSQKPDAKVNKAPLIDNETDNAKSSTSTTNTSIEVAAPKETEKPVDKKDGIEIKQSKDVATKSDSTTGDEAGKEKNIKANGKKSDKKDKKSNGVEKQEETDKKSFKTETDSINKPNDDNKGEENSEPGKSKQDGTINKEADGTKLNEIGKKADDTPVSVKRKAGSSIAAKEQNVQTHVCEKSNNTVDEDELMECLVVEPEVAAPQPTSSVKILKLKASSSILPSYKSPKKDQSAVKKNLEKQISNKDLSVSPASNKQQTISDSCTSTPTVERPSSFRAISGRRSLRPLPERSFQNFYRESYKKTSTELDTTTSSMNVTVGSEVPNDSTLSFFGRGMKRERQGTTDNLTEAELSPKTPKRARLDISGFLNVVKTPISMLRSHFAKTRIQSSTPNINTVQKSEEDGVENVSIIETEEAVDNELTKQSNEIEEGMAEIENEKPLKEAKIESLTNELNADGQADVDRVNERRACTIM